MAVEVRLPMILQKVAGGAKTVKVEGKSIREVFDNLEKNHPGFASRLFDNEGNLNHFIMVYVNNEDIRLQRGMQTELKDGDVITLLPAMAGGEDCCR
ncbi:MAG: MoaD family protein [Dehalococcoidia bacterium]|nr:MoaD family protein [Dehalococcoidia bacterium]